MKTAFRKLGIVCVLVFAAAAAAQEPAPTPAPRVNKEPIIIIPGLTGSDLYNSKTGELVWFKASRSKVDDLRLPIGPNLARNRDNLVTRDILREVKLGRILPEIEIYERLISSLKTRGYTEGDWDSPEKGDDKDTFYVFPYDWRRDNVESARQLVRKVEQLKLKLKRPDLKFNILAHSMGGLISRYAAMYGNADIPVGKPVPTWSGARHFDKIFLLGTPNSGSAQALDSLLNGYSYTGGVNLPFLQNLSRFDVFTIPAAYQLLPHPGTFKVYDDALNELPIDLYNPRTWEEYKWGIWRDDLYKKRFSAAEARYARSYFRVVLARAKRFQEALNAASAKAPPVSFFLIGGDCKDTQAGIVLRRNEKKDRWITQFKPDSFTNSEGVKITGEQLKPLLFTIGDSVVPKSSLDLNGLADGQSRVLPVVDSIFQCEGHTKLVTSAAVQDRIFALLDPQVALQ